MPNETCIRLYADVVQIKECQKKIADNEPSFAQLSRVLALAGNDVRLKILYLLKEENELCPCDLADILAMTVPAISQHLRKMKDADVVQVRKQGQTIYYSLCNEHLSVLEPLFAHLSASMKEPV